MGIVTKTRRGVVGQAETDEGLVSIGKVIDALASDYSDVTQSSLRFLEREGLLTPARTPGGHRLYAPSDIQRVRRIKEWQARRLSLEEIRQRLADLDAAQAPAELAREFLEHALAGDVSAARRTVLAAREVGIALDVLFAEVLRPALIELGDRWARGDVSVAQEKEVSEIARELIADLSLGAARDGGGPDVVAACVSGERHELGLRMVGGLLGARGVEVHFLGADVALGFLIDAVQRRRIGVVLLSVTIDDNLPALREAAQALRAGGSAPVVLAGGQAVDRHRDLVASWDVTSLPLDADALAQRLRSQRFA